MRGMKRFAAVSLALILLASLFPTVLPAAQALGDSSAGTISAGDSHTAVIKADGTLWTWGHNDYGQLGNGTTTGTNAPVKIMDSVASVSVGYYHSMAIQKDGTLWGWGSNAFGQLGDGTGRRSIVPVKIMDDAASVSAGFYYTMAIKKDGSLWAWGLNNKGQLGDGTANTRVSPVKIMDSVASVSAGVDHTVAIKKDGSLWAWGNNRRGQVGDGTTVDRREPVKIMGSVVSVSDGGNLTTAIKKDGTLWTWGNNDSGQLGNGTTAEKLTPVKIMSNVASVSAGNSHALAIKKDGTLWAWGQNRFGELGDGTTTNKSKPVKILSGAASVSAGTGYTVVVKNDGSLWACGAYSYPKSVNGTTADKSKPVKIMAAGTFPKAKHTVTFNTNGGSPVSKKTITHGKKIAKPANPIRKNYTFAGWYKDAALKTAWNFSKNTVTQKTTLYAKWTLKTYTVTFNTNGGTSVSKKTVSYGKKISKPKNPTRKNYNFAGWYKDAALKTAWNFGKNTITQKTTLYAKWTLKKYTVTFNTNGGTSVSKKTVTHGKKITKPKNPTRKGYTFAGWYKDAALKTAWNFSKNTVTQKTTLYAKWSAIPKLEGTVSITGTARYNYTLTADTSKLKKKSGVSTGTITYQWYRNGTAISGATKKTYTLTGSDAGQRISVKITAKNYSGSVTSGTRTVEKLNQPKLSVVHEGKVKTSLKKKDGNFRLSIAGGTGSGGVTWKSSDPSVIGITQKGVASIYKANRKSTVKVTITATKAGNSYYKDAVATIVVEVPPS